MDYIKLKENWAELNKDFGPTGARIIIIVVLLLAAILFFYFGKSTVPPSRPVYRPPSPTLTYKKEGEIKDEAGTFRTTFLVSIQQPPGNFETKFPYKINIPEAECSKFEDVSSEQMVIGAIASSTYKYRTTCRSYRPVIDTGNLFYLINSQ